MMKKRSMKKRRKLKSRKNLIGYRKIATSAPNITYMELNEDSFFELVMDLINE